MSNKTDLSAVNEQRAISGSETQAQTRQEKEETATVKEFSRSKDLSELTMHVRVAAPFQEYYDGQAFSISAVNLTGPFDILPKHHNFISLLTACDLMIRGVIKGEPKLTKISISGGIMHVKQDDVTVFLDV